MAERVRAVKKAEGTRMLLVRRETFCASHRLWNPEKDAAWNEATFGACGRPNGHGHNYVLEVSVEGEIDPASGMVMNLTVLKRALQEAILSKVDHYDLNHDVGFLAGVIPTTENVALAFWHELEQALPAGSLYRLRLWETEKNYVELSRSLSRV